MKLTALIEHYLCGSTFYYEFIVCPYFGTEVTRESFKVNLNCSLHNFSSDFTYKRYVFVRYNQISTKDFNVNLGIETCPVDMVWPRKKGT